MSICICGPSALELFRSHGRLVPDLLKQPRTARTDDLIIETPPWLEDELPRLGVTTKPYHLMVSNPSAWHHCEGVVCHKRSAPQPPRSLVAINDDIRTSSPELLLYDLASYTDFDLIDLVLVGYELCGTYVLDQSWDGMTNTDAPMTSAAKINRCLCRLVGMPGVARARAALSLVHDGSNSPMETILCMLFTLPRKLGGYGLGPVSLNHKIATATGPRWVDVAFTAAALGLEYKGAQAHSIERTKRDDRRQNKLVGSGMTIINVWYEDLVTPHLFEQLVADIFHAMGKRLRIRSASFSVRRALLMQKLMPAITRFGSLV